MRAVLAGASDRKARHSFRRRDGSGAGEIQDLRKDAKDHRSALRTQRKSKYEESHVGDKSEPGAEVTTDTRFYSRMFFCSCPSSASSASSAVSAGFFKTPACAVMQLRLA